MELHIKDYLYGKYKEITKYEIDANNLNCYNKN